MHASSPARVKVTAGVFGLLLATMVGAAWFALWFVTASFIAFLFWGRGEGILPYLKPPFIIPGFYLPFLAKGIVLHFTNDTKAAQTTLLIGITGAIIWSWWLFVYFKL